LAFAQGVVLPTQTEVLSACCVGQGLDGRLPSVPAQPEATRLIRGKVLAALGEPPDLLRVQVKPLWGSY
jgi:hypothetical protein